MKLIDLNSDVGESDGPYTLANDCRAVGNRDFCQCGVADAQA